MKRGVTIATVILAVGILIRLPFILIPAAPNGLNNVDELALALSVVDQWLGLPPIDLCWPGIPLRFFTFVAFAPQFLWSLATDRSLLELSHTIFRHYDDPSSLISVMRLLSAVSGAVAALLAYVIVDKLAKDALAAAAAAIIVTFLPLSMQQSLVGTTDMVALMFAMAAAYGIVTSPARPALAGLAIKKLITEVAQFEKAKLVKKRRHATTRLPMAHRAPITARRSEAGRIKPRKRPPELQSRGLPAPAHSSAMRQNIAALASSELG
jgi:Dolichyl-phosphate-mannose-protein mannosyltransferase